MVERWRLSPLIRLAHCTASLLRLAGQEAVNERMGWISFPPASSVNRPARAIASVVSLLENHVAQTLQSLARSTSPFLSGSWIDVHIITVLPRRVKRGRANKPPDIFLTARCNSPPGFADTAIVPTPPLFQSVFALSPSIFGPLPYPALWLGQQSRFWLPPGVICVSISHSGVRSQQVQPPCHHGSAIGL